MKTYHLNIWSSTGSAYTVQIPFKLHRQIGAVRLLKDKQKLKAKLANGIEKLIRGFKA